MKRSKYQGGGQDDNYLKVLINSGGSNDITAWQGKHSDGTTDVDEVAKAFEIDSYDMYAKGGRLKSFLFEGI